MSKITFEELEEREKSLRNAVFDLCGHLPGVSDEELLAVKKQCFEQLQTSFDAIRAENERLKGHNSRITENTKNFCRHHAPFRTVNGSAGVQVVDRLGLPLARCERIDDAWTIAEALNETGRAGASVPAAYGAHGVTRPTSETRAAHALRCGHRPALIEMAHCSSCNAVFWRCTVCDEKNCPGCAGIKIT